MESCQTHIRMLELYECFIFLVLLDEFNKIQYTKKFRDLTKITAKLEFLLAQ